MTRKRALAASAFSLLLLGTGSPAYPREEPEEIAALKAEIEHLKDQIRLLQEQMKAIAGAAPAPAAPSPAAQAPARSQNLMNPAISAVMQAIGDTSLKRSDPRNGFDLSEAEIAMQSAIDPYAKMDLFLTLGADGSAEVEEGFVTTLSLPGSLSLKGGRFKSAFGKWNTLHDHAFFTVDRPLALANVFGDESLTDDGLSLSVLIPNPWGAYIESVSEVGTPREGTSFNGASRSLAYLEHLSGFFNTSSNATLEIGLSSIRGRTGPADALLDALADPNLAAPPLPGDHLGSAVDGVDVTYKWKPLQLNTYRSFLWQTEWLRSRRHVETLTPLATLEPGVVTSQGGYSYVEDQLGKRWRVGGRYDWSELPDDARARERGVALVVRFVPSEFQELRFQAEGVRRNDAAAARFNGDDDDTRLLFEWIPVIGAHGAHKY